MVDVAGYYVAAGGGGLAYHPLDPARVLDTRNGDNAILGVPAPIGAQLTLDLPVIGTTTTDGGIVALPASAGVAVVNVTAVYPSAGTYLTVFPTPSGNGVPLASNLNPAVGRVTPNLVFSGIGLGGSIRIYNAKGAVHVVADMAGYYG